jgi:hypothetical protein
VNNLVTASERLILSRERICQAMRDQVSPNSGVSKPGAGASTWLDFLTSTPGANVLRQAVNAWWTAHPLRVVCMSAAGAIKTLVEPLAQRHPIGLTAGAAVVGAIVVQIRPWRWLLKPVLFAGLLPQIVVTAAAQVPAKSWIKMLASLMQQTKTKNAVRQADPIEQRPAPAF